MEIWDSISFKLDENPDWTESELEESTLKELERVGLESIGGESIEVGIGDATDATGEGIDETTGEGGVGGSE